MVAVFTRLVDRRALTIFGALVASWFLGPMVRTLVIPSYLLSLFAYDGTLEYLVYPVGDAIPTLRPYVWDAGLVGYYYLYAVGAVAVGGLVASRLRQRGFGVDAPGREAFAGLFLVLGPLGAVAAFGSVVLGNPDRAAALFGIGLVGSAFGLALLVIDVGLVRRSPNTSQ